MRDPPPSLFFPTILQVGCRQISRRVKLQFLIVLRGVKNPTQENLDKKASKEQKLTPKLTIGSCTIILKIITSQYLSNIIYYLKLNYLNNGFIGNARKRRNVTALCVGKKGDIRKYYIILLLQEFYFAKCNNFRENIYDKT